MSNKVTLQISLAPGDYPHAKYIVPAQLDMLHDQVDEILFTVDTQQSKGRFAAGWKENKVLLYALLEDLSKKYNAKVVPVNYTKEVQSAIAEYFFNGKKIPKKDFRGGPFYAYFFGLYTAKHALVFHLDSDILLGGGSKSWITEAISYLQQPDCLIVSPLPGPPHADDLLKGQTIIDKTGPYAFQLEGMSTRLFMTNKEMWKGKLRLTKPGIRNQIKAIVEGNPNADLPEHIISSYMSTSGNKRIDFLGKAPGIWSLHPPFRTAGFYNQLPELMENIKNNQFPEAQRGFYDVIDEVVDWAPARQQLKENRWWKRLLKR